MALHHLNISSPVEKNIPGMKFLPSFFKGPGHIEDEITLFGCIAEMDTKTPPEPILVVKMVKMASDPGLIAYIHIFFVVAKQR